MPPPQVVRHDGDDSYLVVAADKGTATFSDIANRVALDYGFWLGDAFASGGSAGYDHKVMGITARGAWESVRRHFRELGLDTQSEDFTVVGVGDMSGDVFGNGMLLSEHIRLVAAFDHRHVFLDPDPDPATSYAERRRLFDLPRSSWADYDTTLISPGGGVHPRTAKSIPITRRCGRGWAPADSVVAHSRRADAHPARAGGPALERRHRHLRQGQHRDPRRRRRQGQRRHPRRRHRAAGEGGRRGRQPRSDPARPHRVRPAPAAASTPTPSTTARASTPPTTRSTSRSCSTRWCADGDLATKQRTACSPDDRRGRRATSCATTTSRTCCSATRGCRRRLLSVHGRLISALEERGALDRELEFLPSRRRSLALRPRGSGSPRREFAVLVAYSKITLTATVLDSSPARRPVVRRELRSYFPPRSSSSSATGWTATRCAGRSSRPVW